MVTPTEDFQPYDRYLRDLDDEIVFELERAVGDLERMPAWLQLVEIMQAGKQSVVNDLINGKTRDQADYARLAGFAAGLEQMPTAAKAIAAHAQVRRERIAHRQARDEAAEIKELAPDGITPAT